MLTTAWARSQAGLEPWMTLIGKSVGYSINEGLFGHGHRRPAFVHLNHSRMLSQARPNMPWWRQRTPWRWPETRPGLVIQRDANARPHAGLERRAPPNWLLADQLGAYTLGF
jgi:hypothetical protein